MATLPPRLPRARAARAKRVPWLHQARAHPERAAAAPHHLIGLGQKGAPGLSLSLESGGGCQAYWRMGFVSHVFWASFHVIASEDFLIMESDHLNPSEAPSLPAHGLSGVVSMPQLCKVCNA